MITVAGTVKTLTAASRGSGSLSGIALKANDATVTAATSGTIALTVLRSATITASGVGSVEIAGPAACTIANSGSGTVQCEKQPAAK